MKCWLHKVIVRQRYWKYSVTVVFFSLSKYKTPRTCIESTPHASVLNQKKFWLLGGTVHEILTSPIDRLIMTLHKCLYIMVVWPYLELSKNLFNFFRRISKWQTVKLIRLGFNTTHDVTDSSPISIFLCQYSTREGAYIQYSGKTC